MITHRKIGKAWCNDCNRRYSYTKASNYLTHKDLKSCMSIIKKNSPIAVIETKNLPILLEI